MMLCFAYATDSLKESVKYVNNLLTYTLASNSIIMRIFKSIKHVGEDSAGQKDDNQ